MTACRFNEQCNPLCINYTQCLIKYVKKITDDTITKDKQKVTDLTEEFTKLRNKITKLNKINNALQEELHSYKLAAEKREQVNDGENLS